MRAVQKFQNYLYGKEFALETDHQPLIYLKIANANMVRLALALQLYKFRLEGIRGADNIGADFLSRMTVYKRPQFAKQSEVVVFN